MKPLIIELSYDMKTIFLVFGTENILFILIFFGTHWNGSE